VKNHSVANVVRLLAREIGEYVNMCCSLDLRAIANKSYLATYILFWLIVIADQVPVHIRYRSSQKLLPRRTFGARSILHCDVMSRTSL